MGKKKKRKKRPNSSRRPSNPPAGTMAWQDRQGTHVMVPGTPPTPEMMEELTKEYQKRIRNSPLWDEMVKQYGFEKAEEILKECRAELK